MKERGLSGYRLFIETDIRGQCFCFPSTRTVHLRYSRPTRGVWTDCVAQQPHAATAICLHTGCVQVMHAARRHCCLYGTQSPSHPRPRPSMVRRDMRRDRRLATYKYSARPDGEQGGPGAARGCQASHCFCRVTNGWNVFPWDWSLNRWLLVLESDMVRHGTAHCRERLGPGCGPEVAMARGRPTSCRQTEVSDTGRDADADMCVRGLVLPEGGCNAPTDLSMRE